MKKKKVINASVRSFSPTANLVFSIVIATFAIFYVVPFFPATMISLTGEGSLAASGYRFQPKEFSLETYHYIFQGAMSRRIIHALRVTAFIMVTGTIVSVTTTSLYAYVVSRSSSPFEKFFTLFALITVLFSPGTVANHLVITNLLQLKDTIWVSILPLASGPLNILVMRTFFEKAVPNSIIESTHIDDASEMRIFVNIVLPLAVPGIATISLFATLGYWNDWLSVLLYVQKDTSIPLQYLLMRIQNNLEFLLRNTDMSTVAQEGLDVLPSESARMAIAVLPTLPIALTYPLFQKYFVDGLTIGGVKEQNCTGGNKE